MLLKSLSPLCMAHNIIYAVAFYGLIITTPTLDRRSLYFSGIL